MPYEIKQDNDGYTVVNAETGKVYGRHKTPEKAQAQVRALYASEGGTLTRQTRDGSPVVIHIKPKRRARR